MMETEDVIELGSSDDEAEPAPKKSKPMPNAMVCIPRKIHEVTIRPSRLNLNKGVPAVKAVPAIKVVPTGKSVPAAKSVPPTIRVPKSKEIFTIKGVPAANSVFTSKEITIVKGVPLEKKQTTVTKASSIISNPFANKSKPNGKPVQKSVMKPHLKTIKPFKILKASSSQPNVVYATAAETSNLSNVPSALLKITNTIQNNTSLNNLPAGITVKKTTQTSSKPIIFMKAANQMLQSKLNSKQVNDVQTVELDDDEVSRITPSPAWYLRPEEQTDKPTLEQENNAEPKVPTMIEITIEDSPIKPALNKRTCEIGAELAITIDDSPVKATADKNPSPSGSDDEATSTKEPNSKKKLEYPKESGNENRKTVEIDIDFPFEVSLDTNIGCKDEIKKFEKVGTVVVQKAAEPNKNQDAAEFHSVYQSFIDTCFELENSEDMQKIVEKKIKAYYRQVPKEYSESEEFVDMVASKILAMKASPEKMYLYIKDIVDELNMQRKIAKSQILETESKMEEPDELAFGEESEYDLKRQRQIRKLEKTIKKLHRAIQKLEEQEVDFDDEDDSVYLLTERYKERMVRVYAKFCQLTNTKMPSEPRIVLDARPGQPSGPAKRLEKWINKKVPIGTPLPFPDFHDVLRCVRDANDEDKLCWNEADIMEEARDLFTRCGKKLQRRRQENEWRLAVSRIALEIDPAENNEQLKFKLDANKKIAANKETEIFNKYADRQNLLKLEAVEIGDKEAEESPVESEEEEGNDESVSLENKGKRKERLKRLIQEISKGPSEGKESQPTEKPVAVEEDATKPEENEEVVTIKDNDTKDKDNKEDSGEILERSNDKDTHDAAETLSVSSDNSNNLESDIDELHLLQKLHSGNEAESSTLESSDSDSPIAISDSIESGSDTRKQFSDVISIENSSYSESEADKLDDIPVENTESVQLIVPHRHPNNDTEGPVVVDMETDSSNGIETCRPNDDIDTASPITDTKKVITKSNNNECNEAVEDILLASSDEETGGSQAERQPSAAGVCINLKDDLISIDETVVGTVANELEKVVDKEPTVTPEIIPEKVSNTDESSVVEKGTNDDQVKHSDNKVTEKSNDIESISIESSQEIAPSVSKEECAQNDVSVVSGDTKSADTVTNMDANEVDKVLETYSRVVEDSLPPALCSDTQ